MDFTLLKEPTPREKGMSDLGAYNRSLVLSDLQNVDQQEVQKDLSLNGRASIYNTAADENSVNEQKESIRAVVPIIADDTDLTEEEKIEVLDGEIKSIRPDIYEDMDIANSSHQEGLTNYQKIQNRSTNLSLAEITRDAENLNVLKARRKAEYMSRAYEVYQKAISELDEVDFFTGSAQVLGTAFPGNLHAMWISFYNEAFPDETLDPEEFAFPGEILDRAKKRILEMPQEERLVFYERALNIIKDKSFFTFGISDIEAVFAMTELMEDELNGEETDVSEWINNIAGGVDNLFFLGWLYVGGKAAISGLKAARFFWMPRTPIESINSVNPQMVRGLAEAAADNFDSVRNLGISEDDIVLGSVADEGVPLSQVFNDVFTRTKEKAAKMAEDASTNTHTWRPSNLSQAEEGARKVLNRQQKDLQYVRTVAGDTPETIKVQGYVGSGTDEGFLTLDEALEHAERHLSRNKVSETEFYVRDSNGELHLIDEMGDFPNTGSFFYKIENELSIPDALKHSNKHKLHDNDIRKSWMFTEMAESFFDNAAMYSRRLSRWIDSLANDSAGFATQMRDILSPFSKASIRDQNLVIRKLEGLRQDGGEFTAQWILSQGFTDSQALAAYAVKMTGDTLHYIANDKLYRRWVGEGVKKIVLGEDLTSAGVVLKRGDVETVGGFRYYYNQNTKAVERLSRKEVDELYDDGGQIVQLKEFLTDEAGEISSRHVILRTTDRTEELPKMVLNYDPRYIAPKIHDNNVYIREVRSQIKDGSKHEFTTARGGASDWKGANRIKEQLELDNPGKRYKLTYSKELDGKIDEMEEQLSVAQGRLFFSKRGDDLKGEDGYDTVRDIGESLIKGIDSLSNSVIKGDSIEHMKTLFMNTYLKPRGIFEYPRTEKDVPDIKEAKIFWRKIQDLAVLDRGWLGERWRKSTLFLARMLGDKSSSWMLSQALQKVPGSNLASRGLIAISEASPDHILKAMAFKFFIEGAPTRQLFVQGQQFLYLSPIAGSRFPKVLKDSINIVSGLGMRSLGREISPEVTQLLKDLDRSGFLRTVDQHSHMDGKLEIGRGMRADGPIERGLSAVGRTVNMPFSMGKYGFLGGESWNRVASWATARELFFKKHNRYPRTKREMQQTNAQAMQLSFAVHKDSSYYWQKGTISWLTQFMSVQFKGMSTMTVSRAFTKQEKNRLKLGQFLYHGTQGFGLADIVDNFINTMNIEMSPAARASALGGTVDLLFYKMLGEHVNVSESMSAAGGVNNTIWNLYKAWTGTDGKHWFEAVPSLAAAGKAIEAFGDMKFIWDAHEGDPPVSEVLDAAGQITSGWSAYTQAKAVERYNTLLSNSGQMLGLDATPGAIAIRKWLGMRTRSETDYYNLRAIEQGLGGEKDKIKFLSDDAKEMAKRYIRYITKYHTDFTTTPESKDRFKDELLRNIGKLNTAMKFVHGQDDYTNMRIMVEDHILELDSTSMYNLQSAILDNISEGLKYRQDEEDKLITHIVNTMTGLDDSERNDVELTIKRIKE